MERSTNAHGARDLLCGRLEHLLPLKKGVVQGVGFALPSIAHDGDHLGSVGHIAAQLACQRLLRVGTELFLVVEEQKTEGMVVGMETQGLELIGEHIGQGGTEQRGRQTVVQKGSTQNWSIGPGVVFVGIEHGTFQRGHQSPLVIRRALRRRRGHVSIMACCGSEESRADREISREIDKKLKLEKRESRQEIKLLLLGPSESGKSTFCKQIKIIYGSGFPIAERAHFIPLIHQNVFKITQDLVQALEGLQIVFGDRNLQIRIKNILKIGPLDANFAEASRAIAAMWNDSGVLEAYARRNEFLLSDSAGYFMENLKRIQEDAYLPSEEDILRARAPTTGISEYCFKLKKNFKIRIVDVGGQRSERRKWIHVFDNVTSVMFIMSLAEFDQTLLEAPDANRLEESVALFRTIITFKWFCTSSIILFLNKKDILQHKIQHSRLGDYFSGFQGPDKDAMAARSYILDLYLGTTSSCKPVYNFFTCATDSNNFKHVFDAVKDTILCLNLEDIHLKVW
eukprot:snap_masked-scaffold410_size180147-processed-gene-0.21 protein:Tk11888 transcript:snap_masked-scaffold410_size180147-processed-gene-0.21-mRNA-1 annotation:"hypothetical protein TRIADDRAFT_64258"